MPVPFDIDSRVHCIAEAVSDGSWDPEDIVEAFLEHVHREDCAIHAFLHLDEASIRKQARALNEKRARGERLGCLAGVPVAIKDSICTLDAPTTCASRCLMTDGVGWSSCYDATAVARLRQADAIIFGKTNLDEFAMGSSTQESGFFSTRNPWNLDHVPGGSSGGSAAAVAARMVPVALGSDTGGSLRQPASFTSTVGFKPTYGRVSRSGLVAFASSLDQVGPIASDVRGAARVLGVIAGWDARDATSARLPVPDLEGACFLGIDGLRIGVPEEYFDVGLDVAVACQVRDALAKLADAGCDIRTIRLPHTRFAVAAYYVLSMAEASSNLARFDGIRFGASMGEGRSLEERLASTRGAGLGREVKRRILLGTYVLSAGYYDAYYARAQRARAHIAADFDRVFETVDVVATPTAPSAAWALGEKLDEPMAMYLSDVYTLPSSLAGLPAISVPCGWTNKGLPIGLQLIGPRWCEDLLCRVAYAWEGLNRGHDVTVVTSYGSW